MTCSCDKECDCNKPKAHPHAELMAQYAEDAKKTDRPWELWEVRADKVWLHLLTHPRWEASEEYRRKPQKKKLTKYMILYRDGSYHNYLFDTHGAAHASTASPLGRHYEIREITWEVEV